MPEPYQSGGRGGRERVAVLLNAVTATRKVEPASLEAIRCVDAVWPAIGAHTAPALSQRSH